MVPNMLILCTYTAGGEMDMNMYKGGAAPRGPHPRRGGRGGYQPGRGRGARSGATRSSMSDESNAAPDAGDMGGASMDAQANIEQAGTQAKAAME